MLVTQAIVTVEPGKRNKTALCERLFPQPLESAMNFDSTAIRTIGYDADRAKLQVQFVSGEHYVYVGVPAEVHRSFLDADSKGRFFLDEIRDCYPFNRVRR